MYSILSSHGICPSLRMCLFRLGPVKSPETLVSGALLLSLSVQLEHLAKWGKRLFTCGFIF